MFLPIRSLLFIYTIIAFSNVHASFSRLDCRIELEQGIIAGTFFDYIGGGGRYRAFLGIPYARPPINELRFKSPVPVAKHEGVLDTDTFGSACLQKIRGSKEHKGSEDCLYLNVYIPIIEHATQCQKLPVMFYIHGGGYISGDGSWDKFGPDYLLKKGVIVVTINYRLGVFGFFAAPDLGIYSNMGLKDQRLALKWVHDNIEKFGGDKNRITIFGESAGGASVNYLLMDPTARQYISGAILESGCSLCPWSIQFQPETRFNNLTEALCLTHVTLEKLQSVSATDLLDASMDKVPTQDDQNRFASLTMVFVPTIEDSRSDDPILTESIQRKIDKGELPDVPTIMGFNSAEGIFATADVALDPARVLNTLRDVVLVIPRDFHIWENPKGELEQLAIGKLKKLYDLVGDWEHTKTDDEKLDIFMRLFEDLMVFHPTYRTLRGALEMPRRIPPLYHYKFADDSYSLMKTYLLPDKYKNLPGCSHEDELGYLFTMTNPYGKDIGAVDHIPDKGRLTNERMVTMWTNFAKTGNPTSNDLAGVTWDPIVKEVFKYLEIRNGPVIGMPPYSVLRRMKVWDEVLKLGLEAHEIRQKKY